jgi:tetratricopeptide (TPR) repeat protein
MEPAKQWTPRIQRITKNEGERLRHAFALMRERRFSEAHEELQQILAQNDQSFAAHMTAGFLLQRQKKPDEALAHFMTALAIDPMHARAHVMAGLTCLALKDLDQAETLTRSALDIDPKQVFAHNGMARVLRAKGDTKKALAHLNKALEIDPAHHMSRLLLALLLNKEGRVEEAVKQLNDLLQIAPGNPFAAMQLARIYSEKGENQKAVEILERIVRNRPEASNAWTLLGRTRMRMANYKGAEEAFHQASQRRPKDPLGSLRQVEAMVPQGKLDQARDMLRRIPRRGRLAALVHKYYGDIYLAEKKYSEAAQSYRASILNGENGEKSLAEIDAAMAKASGGPSTAIKRYREEIDRRLEAAREKMGDQDWERIFEQMQPQIMEQFAARRRAAVSAPRAL